MKKVLYVLLFALFTVSPIQIFAMNSDTDSESSENDKIIVEKIENEHKKVNLYEEEIVIEDSKEKNKKRTKRKTLNKKKKNDRIKEEAFNLEKSDSDNESEDERIIKEKKDEELKRKGIFPTNYFNLNCNVINKRDTSFDADTESNDKQELKRKHHEIEEEEIDGLCDQIKDLGLVNYFKDNIDIDYKLLLNYLSLLDDKNFILPISNLTKSTGEDLIKSLENLELGDLAKEVRLALSSLILNIELIACDKQTVDGLIKSFFNSFMQKVESDKEAVKSLNDFFKERERLKNINENKKKVKKE